MKLCASMVCTSWWSFPCAMPVPMQPNFNIPGWNKCSFLCKGFSQKFLKSECGEYDTTHVAYNFQDGKPMKCQRHPCIPNFFRFQKKLSSVQFPTWNEINAAQLDEIRFSHAVQMILKKWRGSIAQDFWGCLRFVLVVPSPSAIGERDWIFMVIYVDDLLLTAGGKHP